MRLLNASRTTKAALLLLVGALAAVSALVIIDAQSSSRGDARVAMRIHEDGRIEAAIQTHDGTDWSARRLPDSRFLSPDVTRNRWYHSSAVPVDASAGYPLRFCVITHEGPGDEGFWGQVRAGVNLYAFLNDNVTVDYHASPDPAVQAQILRDCVDGDADGIAVTMPDPAALQEAISYAFEERVLVVSFNSGRSEYEAVGSHWHASVNEFAIGATAGGAFNAAALGAGANAGEALCLVHEANNIGLQERCDGLASTYNGPVTVLDVSDSGTADLAATRQAVSDALTADTAAVFGLNARIAGAALDAVQAAGSSAAVASVDVTAAQLEQIRDGELDFAIFTNAAVQVREALAWLLRSSDYWDAVYSAYLTDEELEGGALFTFASGVADLEPIIVNPSNAARWLQVFNRYEGFRDLFEADPTEAKK